MHAVKNACSEEGVYAVQRDAHAVKNGMHAVTGACSESGIRTEEGVVNAGRTASMQ